MAQRPDIPDDPLLLEGAADISGGVQDNGATHLIPPGKTAYLLNIATNADGQRQKRRGVLARGTPGGASNPNGLFAFDAPGANFHHLVLQQANDLYSTDGDNVAVVPRATTVSLYDTIHYAAKGEGMPASSPQTTLFLAAAVPFASNVSLPYDKLTCINRDWGVTQISAAHPRAIAWYQNRLWTFGDSVNGPDVLAWSAVLDGQNFDHGTNEKIDPNAGDQGTAIYPLRTGQPSMLLFKERSIHLLEIFWDTDGYYPSAANTLDYSTARVRPVVTGTGCIATRSVIGVPGLRGGDVLFLSREGIRSLNRSATDAQGGAGLPLSFPIQNIIDRVNWAQADKCCAAFWDGVAYFSVPLDGSTDNNFVIAYNVNRQSWYFLDWEVAAWADAGIDTSRKFFFFGQSSGTDGQSTYTVGHHIYETDRGQVDPFQAPIVYEEQTRGFSFPPNDQPGSGLQNRKVWRSLELRARGAATTATLAVQYKLDDDSTWRDWRNFSIAPEDAYPVLPAQLPFVFESGKIVQKNLSLHAIPPGRKLQFRFLDTTSFGRIDVLDLNIRASRLQERFS